MSTPQYDVRLVENRAGSWELEITEVIDGKRYTSRKLVEGIRAVGQEMLLKHLSQLIQSARDDLTRLRKKYEKS